MSLIRSSCSATHIRAPTSPTRRVPSVRVNPKSATGGSSADPSTACRAKGRCRSGSHTDWDAIRYRRPPTTRSNMFILSSSHILALLSTKRYICKVENPSPLELAAHNCESRASAPEAAHLDLSLVRTERRGTRPGRRIPVQPEAKQEGRRGRRDRSPYHAQIHRKHRTTSGGGPGRPARNRQPR